MLFKDSLPTTLAGVIHAVENSGLPVTRRRDLVSAVKRICEMSGHTPTTLQVNPSVLRTAIADIRPAAHRIADGTFANIRSNFGAALASAGVIDRAPRGEAGRDPAWGPLVAELSDPVMRHGLSSFLNWCAWRGVSPSEMSDGSVDGYHLWLETRTLCPRPRDAVARTPRLWNQARDDVPGWPDITLTEVSFRKEPEHLTWDEFDTRYRHDAAAYLEMRRSPDVFDDDPDAPAKPLAESTLRQHREHLRLAGALLVEKGLPVETLTGLAMLVEIEAFKTILRHYHDKADGKASPFATSMATILKQVALYFVRVDEAHYTELKRIASCLPTVEHDLTEKNKALLREFKDPACRARLLFLPETLLAAVARDINAPRLHFVDAQVAIAVDIALVAPLRPQNLVALDWGRHFSQPDGARGRLVLHIPAAETKTGKRDLTFEIPPDIAKRIKTHGGAALIIDYGYVESRPGDTLQAVLNHKTHPVLEAPGSADICAHVDFAMLAHSARQCGVGIAGPVEQGAFLRSLGIAERARALQLNARRETVIDIGAALERLTGPGAMGNLFKVLCLRHPDLPNPAGFEAGVGEVV